MKNILFRKRQLELVQSAVASVVFNTTLLGEKDKEELRRFYEKRLIAADVS